MLGCEVSRHSDTLTVFSFASDLPALPALTVLRRVYSYLLVGSSSVC